MPTGIVIALARGCCLVDDGAIVVECAIRGKLYRDRRRSKPVVVGDRVRFASSPSGGAVVEEVEPRRTKLSRQRVSDATAEQVLVANIDRVLVVASVRDPAYDPFLSERVFVAARSVGIDPVLVVNKSDLPADGSLERLLAPLERYGVPVLRVSAATGRGIDEIRETIRGRTCALCGPSGVGKSSLVNRLIPDARRRTGEVLERTRTGRHVTSDVVLLKLPEGGYLIDMPGLRKFGLWDVTRDDVEAFFSVILGRASQCRHRGCTHTHEPDCGVKDAVAAGEIGVECYESYVRLVESS